MFRLDLLFSRFVCKCLIVANFFEVGGSFGCGRLEDFGFLCYFFYYLLNCVGEVLVGPARGLCSAGVFSCLFS